MDKKKLGARIVTQHGLISNVLIGLDLAGQLAVSNINSRTYSVTVPWNV